MHLNDFAWLYQQKGILTIHAIGALVVFAVPEDILDKSSYLALFIGFFASHLPIIDNFSVKSDFPSLARLHITLMLFLSPYFAYIWMKWPDWAKNRSEMLRRAQKSYLRLFLFYILIFLIGISGYSYLFLANGSDFHLLPFFSSKLALAISGPVFFSLVPAGFFVVLVQMCRTVLK
jgi:hypothetical protein